MRIPPTPFDTPKALLWLAIIATLAVLVVPEFFNSASQFSTGHWFEGVDTYMRVLRIREWIDAGQWHESFSHRSNWPYGEKLHWTRPMDVAITALAMPFLPFLDMPNALYAGALIASPVFYLLAVLVLLWGSKGFLDARGRIIFVVLFALQPTMHFYFVFARPDHHSLILFVFALVLALLARHANAHPGTPEHNSRLPGWAGIAAAFGIWVSIEMLTVELFALMALAAPWLIRGDPRFLRALGLFSRWGALALAAFLVVERPPSEWLTSEVYDRLSTVHVFVLALIAIGMTVITKAQSRFGDTWIKRLALSAGIAALAGVILYGVYPDFFKGPFGAAMDPRLKQLWLDTVVEFQTLAEPTSNALVSAIFLLAPLIWLGVWAVWTFRDPGKDAQNDQDILPLILTFVIAALIFTPLTIVQSRWAAYMGVLYTVPWAVLLTRILDWRGGPIKAGTPILRTPMFVTVMLGHALVAALLSGALEDAPPKAEACHWREIAPYLNSSDFGGGAPQTIFNFTHNGPEIIYRTHHRVVGTPYHRNAQGILDSYTVLGGVNMAVSKAILQHRGVDFLITCVDSVDERLMLKEKGDTLIRRLVEGRAPSWLVKWPLPDGLDTHFRVYAFVPTSP